MYTLALAAEAVIIFVFVVIYMDYWRFFRAGFAYENLKSMSGWLSRDPANNDWIFWDVQHNMMLRSSESDRVWIMSNKTKKQCLQLGRAYKRSQQK
jgi:hypothetical protein